MMGGNMLACKDDCRIKYQAKSKRYADGAKWCRTCGQFIQWEGRYCPCCGFVLRRQSYDKRYTKNKIEVARIA